MTIRSASRFALGALATAAALTAVPAQAASMAAAELSQIHITLIDMNFGDGIAPSVSFHSPNGTGSFVSVIVGDSFVNNLIQTQQFGNGPFAFLSVAPSTTMSAGWGLVNANGSPEGAQILALGNAQGTLSTDPFGGFSSLYSVSALGVLAPGFGDYFRLSANTAMIITAKSYVSAEVTNSWVSTESIEMEHAFARTGLRLEGPPASGQGGGEQLSVDNHEVVVDSDNLGDNLFGPKLATGTKTLSVSFVNASGGFLDGRFSAGVAINGFSQAMTVPEPQTYALMLAGLAAVGLVARRRRAAR